MIVADSWNAGRSEILRGAIVLGRIEERKIRLLEQEITELEGDLKQRMKETNMDKTMQALDTIEKAVAASGGNFRKLREQAEGLYDDVVKDIMKRDGCNASTAHARASADPIGQEAYAKVVEMQEAERCARDGAGRIAAYVD